jgi:hypothetical protein
MSGIAPAAGVEPLSYRMDELAVERSPAYT